jgi:hypothetical protein
MEQASRGSVGSYSSDESALGVPQHIERLMSQPLSTAHQSSTDGVTRIDTSQAYANSNAGVNQYSAESPYAVSTYPASFDGSHHIPLSVSGDQTPPQTVQPSYSTMSQRDSIVQSSSTLWGPPVIDSHPISNNGVSATVYPPYRPDYTSSLGTPYYPVNNRGIQYENSPYPSPSSEQGTSYSQSKANLYIEETQQQSNWPKQRPAKPQ